MGLPEIFHTIRRDDGGLELADIEGPYERFQRFGVRGLSASDLLALLGGCDEDKAQELLPLATSLLASRGINGLVDLSIADLAELGETDPILTVRLLSAVELGRRSGVSNKGERKTISRAADVARHFAYLQDEGQEHLCAMFMNVKNGVIGSRTIHVGTLNMSVVGAREVFREAVRCGASSVIVVHNHPSGDPEPSPEDLESTASLVAAGKLLDIPVLDHIIIGHNRHVSFKERKLI